MMTTMTMTMTTSRATARAMRATATRAQRERRPTLAASRNAVDAATQTAANASRRMPTMAMLIGMIARIHAESWKAIVECAPDNPLIVERRHRNCDQRAKCTRLYVSLICFGSFALV